MWILLMLSGTMNLNLGAVARTKYRNVIGIVVNQGLKFQTLVYDILPSTTAVFSYAIGS